MKKVRIMALASAIITALSLLFFLKTLGKPADVSKTGVLVATVNIASNTAVTKDMVAVKYLPNEAVYANAVKNSSQVVGKVATADIVVGEQLISTQFAAAGKSGADSLAYTVKPGMRAITIAVDDVSGLSGMIKPGNRVDVIAMFNNDKDAAKAATTAMLLENINVLAVDSVISANGKAVSKDGKTTSYGSITLEVSPAQAMKASISEYKGKLKVILRSPLDSQSATPPEITLNDVIS